MAKGIDFKATVILVVTTLVLILSYAASESLDNTVGDASNSSSDVTTTPKTVKARGYDLITEDGLKGVYKMANGFLVDIVQTRNLRWLEDRGVDFTDPDAWEDEDWELWVDYFIGYIICIGIGVLLMILMPIIGFCTCCCRCCCGNCGGKVRPKDKENSNCRRTCFGISLFVILLIVVVGGVTLILCGLEIQTKIDPADSENVYEEFAVALDNLETYKDTSVQEINDTTLGEFRKTKTIVFTKLDGLGFGAIVMIENSTSVISDLLHLRTFENHTVPAMIGSLERAELLSQNLENNATQLNVSLKEVQDEVLPILTNIASCADEEICQNAAEKLEELTVNMDYNSFSFATYMTRLKAVPVDEIDTTVETNLLYLKTIEDEIDALVASTTVDVKTETDELELQVVDFVEELEDNSEDMDFGTASEDLRDVDNDVDSFVWDVTLWCLILPGVLVLLICIFMFLGLICGGCCARPPPRSSKACSSWRMGAHFLLVGITVTFIFYWLLMFLLVTLFATGGALHTELCRHLVDLEDSPVADIVTEMVNATVNENQDFEVNISEIYMNCQNNMALYTALNLDEKEGLNITEVLNIDEVTANIDKLKDIHIPPFPSHPYLDSTLAVELQTLNAELDNMSLDLSTYRNVLLQPVVNYDLSDLAAELEEVSEIIVISDRDVVKANVDILRNLETSHVDVMTLDQDAALIEVNYLLDTLNETHLSEWVDTIQAAEVTLNTDLNEMVEDYISKAADGISEDIVDLVDGIDYSIRHEVANCYPLFDSYIRLVDTACVVVLYPVNGYWFTLGWCLIFLLPAIVLSFKLVSLYRKTVRYSVIWNGDDDGGGDEEEEKRRRRRRRKKEEEEDAISTVNSKEHLTAGKARRNHQGGSSSIAMNPMVNPVYQQEQRRLARPTNDTKIYPVLPSAPPAYYDV